MTTPYTRLLILTAATLFLVLLLLADEAGWLTIGG